MKAMRSQRLWWAMGALALVATALATVLPLHEWDEAFERSLHYHSVFVSVAIFGAAYVVGTLIMLPAWIFPVAAGAAFGFWWGLMAAVVSSVIAALAAFVIGRFILRERIERVARRDEMFKAVAKAVERDPVKVIALLRMSPVLPSGLKSYFLGLTAVETMQYLVASALGMLPGNVLKVWVGSAGRDALSDGEPMKWALLGLGAAATVGVAFIIGRIARKRLGL
jgi:uncharacterized membrane protein YdjX (TVP38/TMEM64 family)